MFSVTVDRQRDPWNCSGMIDKEAWHDVPGTSGRYRVSTHNRAVGPTGPIKPYVGRGSNVYAAIKVSAPGEEKRWQAKLHVVIAEAVMGPRPPGMVIDHIDRNPQNNRPENLRYVNQRANAKNSDRWLAELRDYAGENDMMLYRKAFDLHCTEVADELGITAQAVTRLGRLPVVPLRYRLALTALRASRQNN